MIWERKKTQWSRKQTESTSNGHAEMTLPTKAIKINGNDESVANSNGQTAWLAMIIIILIVG